MGCWTFVSPRFEKQLACKVRVLFGLVFQPFTLWILLNKIGFKYCVVFNLFVVFAISWGWSVDLPCLSLLWVSVAFTISSMKRFSQPLSPETSRNSNLPAPEWLSYPMWYNYLPREHFFFQEFELFPDVLIEHIGSVYIIIWHGRAPMFILKNTKFWLKLAEKTWESALYDDLATYRMFKITQLRLGRITERQQM